MILSIFCKKIPCQGEDSPSFAEHKLTCVIAKSSFGSFDFGSKNITRNLEKFLSFRVSENAPVFYATAFK